VSLAESWQKAEVGGPKKALLITKPAVVVTMIKKAKRPILVVGSGVLEKVTDDKALIDLIIQLAQKGKIPVVATAHIVGEFLKRNFKPTSWMPSVDIANRLIDREWLGLDGKGQYDLALFIELPYYMEWILLNTLKHFAPSIKTVSLDKTYQPNASWSFSNLTVEDWVQNLEEIISKLGAE
jgi:acetyl-CoA decarbonylase/synthase complex subunit epsilon